MSQTAEPAAASLPSAARYDIKLLFPTLFLVGIGIVMVYSASSALALKKFGSDYYFLKRQAFFTLAGIVALVLCTHLPYRIYRALAYPLLIAAVLLLLAIPFSGLGYSAGGSARWLKFGLVSFQPSEFARFALIVYLAYSLSKKWQALDQFAVGFVPHVAVLGVLAVLIGWQPDFGSILILGAITWIMMFIAGVRLRYLLASMLLLLPLAYWFLMRAEYRIKRIVSFMDPWQYPANEGYQIVHSLMAFGSGGLWGSGIGQSYQKLFYLPEPHTDFIFAVIGEELGLWGIMVIMVLYVLILWRGVQIAKASRDPFGALVAIGITTAITLQVCINMGVSLGLLPTKGLTLPFLSYGGTSLLLNLASIGVLMNIGAGVRK